MIRTLFATATVILGIVALVNVAYPQIYVPPQQQPPMALGKDTAGRVHIEPVRGNIYMLAGDGGNVNCRLVRKVHCLSMRAWRIGLTISWRPSRKSLSFT